MKYFQLVKNEQNCLKKKKAERSPIFLTLDASSPSRVHNDPLESCGGSKYPGKVPSLKVDGGSQQRAFHRGDKVECSTDLTASHGGEESSAGFQWVVSR